MASVAEKRQEFRRLHEAGCFVLPNPWDVGSALYLQRLGFKALATTSSGAAWSMGFADGEVPLDRMLAHIAEIVRATDLPVNADFLAGFASEPEGVAANVRAAVATGVAGLSIEDTVGDMLFEAGHAVERVRAARAAIDAEGGDTLFVARTEVFFTKHPEPLKEAIRRLTAFAEAGADCLYAPGVATREDIAAIVKAVAPKPVNVLVRGVKGATVAVLADLGVRRISVGGAMARAAWTGFMRSAREIVEHGSFDGLAEAVGGGELNAVFAGRGEQP